MALLDDIAGVLEDAGVGTFGTDLFAASFPAEAPDDCLAIFEYSGGAGEDAFGGGGPAIEQPRVQVMGRGGRYEVVRAKVHDAYLALLAVADQQLDGRTYQCINALQPPFATGVDAKGLHRVTCNFEVYKDPE